MPGKGRSDSGSPGSRYRLNRTGAETFHSIHVETPGVSGRSWWRMLNAPARAVNRRLTQGAYGDSKLISTRLYNAPPACPPVGVETPPASSELPRPRRELRSTQAWFGGAPGTATSGTPKQHHRRAAVSRETACLAARRNKWKGLLRGPLTRPAPTQHPTLGLGQRRHRRTAADSTHPVMALQKRAESDPQNTQALRNRRAGRRSVCHAGARLCRQPM